MTTTRRRSPLAAWVALAIAALICAGCASQPASTETHAASDPTDTTERIDALCADQRVVACEVSTQSLLVTVGAAVSDADTAIVLSEVYLIAEQSEPELGAHLQRESVGAPELDAEFAAPAPWTLSVYPGSLEEAQTGLADRLAVENIAGTRGIDTSSGWPFVTIDDITQFADVFAAVSATPMFEAGGTYTLFSVEERLRIVHTPRWVMDELIGELIAISSEYPAAEVLLEAPLGGAEPPSLYISGLTPDEVTAIATRLSAFPDGSADGVTLSYTLGTVGSDGVTYTNGVLGEAP